MVKTIYQQDPKLYIPALATALKTIPEFQVPSWVYFVKTGTSKERPPVDENFWYIRAASILRQLYLKGVVGVGRLRVRYGSRKDRGVKPDKFRKAGGKIIRLILQQAEAAGLVEKVSKMQHGRRLTTKGKTFLDNLQVTSMNAVDLNNVKIVQQLQEQEEDEENMEQEA